MATTADAPPSSTDRKPPNPGVSPAVQPSTTDHQVTMVDSVKESSPTSAFVNSEPIREDQVANAVKFLSHPKVRGSPVIYRRSFLERKGLTKEEIEEAFRRVPDPSPAVATTQPVTNSDGQIKPSSKVQQQPPAQILQSTSGIPVSSVPKKGRFSHFHWSHVLFALGFLTASGAGTAVLFKNAIIPRLKSWIRKVVLEEEKEERLLKKNNGKQSIEEEAAAAAKAAAVAAADVARASQEILLASNEEKRFFEELISTLNVQVREMKSMSNAIKKLEDGQSISRRIVVDEKDYQRVSQTSSRLPYTNGKANIDAHSVRSLSPPAVEPFVGTQSKPYTEIMDLIQNGENPFNIRDINDASSIPNQPVLNPLSDPRPKPWEFSRSQNSSTNILKTQESGNISSYELPDNQLSGDDPVPWWQQKNPRITEIKSSDEQKFGPSNILGIERPVQRSWVPPQPPPVAIPEAAAAIRQPKKRPYQKEEMPDDQLLARAPDVTDELQRITKISESGGFVDSQVSSTEIPKEDNGS